MRLPDALNPAQGFPAPRIVIPVPDDPDGCNRFCRIGLEDDAPVAITDHDLAPTGKPSPQGQAGIIPYSFQAKQLLEVEGWIARGCTSEKIVDCLRPLLNVYGQLIGQPFEFFTGVAEAFENFVQ